MLIELKEQEWRAIQNKIVAWRERFERVKAVLEATPAQQAPA